MPPEALMRSLLAGWICGAGLAFAVAAVMLVSLARSQASGRNWLPGWERVKPAIIGAMFVNILIIAFTAAGLVLGALYYRAREHYPSWTLITPNLWFSLAVTFGIAGILSVAAFVRQRVGWLSWRVAALAVLAFGWALPNIAR